MASIFDYSSVFLVLEQLLWIESVGFVPWPPDPVADDEFCPATAVSRSWLKSN